MNIMNCVCVCVYEFIHSKHLPKTIDDCAWLVYAIVVVITTIVDLISIETIIDSTE